MKKRVVPSLEFLEELTDIVGILVERDYFSSEEYAQQYIQSMTNYIRQSSNLSTNKHVPSIFHKYGKNLKYITYKANSHTTWYVMFEEYEDSYVIRHITNSHISGQYFNV